MNATTATAPHWIDDNGRVVCRAHAGMYLTSAITADPTAPIYFTPLGSWVRITADDAPCEDCR